MQKMATCYPGSSNESDALPTPYIQSPKLAAYAEQRLLPGNVVLHLSQAPSDGSYSETLVGSSLSHHKCVENPTVGGGNEVVFIPRMGDSVCAQSISGQLNTAAGDPVGNSFMRDPQMIPRTQSGILDGEQNPQYQGLSLSLSSEIPSTVPGHALPYQYLTPGLSSMLNTHFPGLWVDGCGTISCKDDESSQNSVWKNSECSPSDLPGGNHNATKLGDLNSTQCSITSREMNPYPCQYEMPGSVSTILNSKYLKAAQQLLDEIVNVWEALKHPKFGKHKNFHVSGLSEETGERSNSITMLTSINGISSEFNESVTNSSELSPGERQDLQNKKAKLLSMLDEVDRRYRQYYYQMQIVVSSFDTVAGCGAAKSYTALALQTISRHFRCLHDTIAGQIQQTQKSLGEQDTSLNCQGGGITRLRYVDQQVKQQRTLQHLGVIRHAWRPQRGLPESSVSILRAWLFEHFLHPYPKDSEKSMLARQTGLTRNQVANWFINARVRLWKPMVEEMYKEEFGDSELNSKSSPENAAKPARDNSWASETRGEELQESATSRFADSGHPQQCHNLKSDLIPDIEMNGPAASANFQNGAYGDDMICMVQLQANQRSNVDNLGVYHSEIFPPDQNVAGGLVAAAAAAQYRISNLDDVSVDSQVSLALGLQHCESDAALGGSHFRGDDTGTQQHRFGKPHLLHEVA
ncbi:BEL1-like homeodomain protein 3 isoform X2 [Malania oleifera]|nr:BEL1-like homeodomain protein 3 isoform X2 [Malania oleifera]XP_057975780.1 BEL1-like homeodomain protein 3 isoform X2 [Malania oleifera]XP_057975781.1 BEL1-like homeodomain protein 3 isoform X2 [Malania oleifera]XP_057975782.1 BEL1-like homeodomain protein 3 isoform X2 [Malania oleifera]XP_057975783.1 BEL1-like homeodomain protein 3 isoform X2 [Malania oleifera]XP_057975785.1 BEL1-like homeodomain protein 3 isoform X2 [Malania oleifera]